MGRAGTHVGVDFDNTLVIYDAVFHRHALAAGLIDAGVARRKEAVKERIRALPGGDDHWTRLQGLVYTLKMPEADPAPGVEEFFLACAARGVRVTVVSHKTERPALGPPVSMRAAALAWLRDRGFFTRLGLRETDVVFADTQQQKVGRIAALGLSHFIDDLPAVLLRPDWPRAVAPILYDPAGTARAGLTVLASWGAIRDQILGGGHGAG